MLSGSSRTGLRTPNTPGSKCVGPYITRTGPPTFESVAKRTARRTRHQRMSHQKALPAMPQIHTPVRTPATLLVCGVAGAAVETTDRSVEKGWLILAMIMDTAGGVAT